MYLPSNVKATFAGSPVEIGSNFVIIDGKTFNFLPSATLVPNIAGGTMTVLHGGDVTIGSNTIHSRGLAITISVKVPPSLPCLPMAASSSMVIPPLCHSHHPKRPHHHYRVDTRLPLCPQEGSPSMERQPRRLAGRNRRYYNVPHERR